MPYDRDRAAQFVLALMYLELHEGSRAWKSYPWDVLDRLFEQGLITDPKSKAKSVVLLEEGLAEAEACFHRLLSVDSARDSQPKPSSLSVGLPDVQRARIEALLEPFCRPHPDPVVSSQVRVGYRFERASAILFESRPAYDRPREWVEAPIAKFTFNKTRNVWRLFCMFRDLKWHAYQPLPESPDVARLVSEVRADPTGIFWG